MTQVTCIRHALHGCAAPQAIAPPDQSDQARNLAARGTILLNWWDLEQRCTLKVEAGVKAQNELVEETFLLTSISVFTAYSGGRRS